MNEVRVPNQITNIGYSTSVANEKGPSNKARANDLENFSDLLDIAIMNLNETSQHHELGDGSLYTKLQH